ncbi:MAG: hypothetical protein ACRCYY_00575 [Trueperaceae bacterium]
MTRVSGHFLLLKTRFGLFWTVGSSSLQRGSSLVLLHFADSVLNLAGGQKFAGHLANL